MLIRTVFGACTLLLTVAFAADVQAFPRLRRPQIKTDPVSIDGTIERITPTMIQAVDGKDQKSWIVASQRTTKILVKGSATLDFLKPGMIVEFHGQPDAKGVIKDKISDLTIVTPATEVVPAAGEGGSGKTKPAGKEKPAAKEKPTEPAGGSGSMVGQIRARHNRSLSIHVGNKLTQIELTEDPKINVAVDNAAWATRGDKIVVKGKMVHGNPGFCEADEVTITLVEPLIGSKKKVTPPKNGAASPEKATSAEKSDASAKSADSGDDPKPKKKKKPGGDDPFSPTNSNK
jgi:hypothetical protein